MLFLRGEAPKKNPTYCEPIMLKGGNLEGNELAGVGM